MSLNQELHEALGYCWHEERPDILRIDDVLTCRKCGYKTDDCQEECIPDYVADPRLVIREIDKQGKRKDFINYLLRTQKVWLISDMLVDLILDTAGKLAQLALDWIKEQKEE